MVLTKVSLRDWARTPVFRAGVLRENKLQAFVQCLPAFEVIRLVNLSRENCSEPGPRALLEKSISQMIDQDGVEYNLMVLKAAKPKENALIQAYKQATHTLQLLLAQLGRLHTYPALIQRYKQEAVDFDGFHTVTIKLFQRCE